MNKEYFVSIMNVIYTDCVYANSKEEAIEMAMANCPYDVESNSEIYVKEEVD